MAHHIKKQIKKRFSKAYFTSYCSEGPYQEQFRFFSEVDTCCSVVQHQNIAVKTLVVLGTATGEVLKEFHRELGVIPYGCEISRWAYERIPQRYQRKIVHADMNTYLRNLVKKSFSCDLIFSNSLFYLERKSLEEVCSSLSKLTDYFHFHTVAEGDDWVRIQEPYAWWKEFFAQYQFVRTRSPYLWRNGGRMN